MRTKIKPLAPKLESEQETVEGRGNIQGVTKPPTTREIYAGPADLAKIVESSWQAIVESNQPTQLFRYAAGKVARIIQGQNGDPIVEFVNADGLRLTLARAAHWYTTVKNGKRQDAKPPIDVARALLVDQRSPLPVLDRIVRAPIVAPDDTFVLTHGYHPQTRVFYAHGELKLPTIPDRPSEEDITKARSLIFDDLLLDFPFVSDADRANCISLLLLPTVRQIIAGPTPIHLIEKPTPGTGAGLLVDAIAQVVRGSSCPLMTEGGDDDEWRKRITAALLQAPEILLFDNIRKRLDSAALSAAVTAPVWTDRWLGHSKMISVKVRCAWVLTANNPAVSSEISRRSISIRLDAKIDRPWKRPGSSFKHPDLLLWTRENRGRLITAVLTLVQAWIVAGKPKGNMTLGSFEDWAKIMGGILDVAGIGGFLANLERFYDRADIEGEQWRSFLSVWWEKYREEPVGVKDLFDLSHKQDLPFDLGKGAERSQRIKLGAALAHNADRRFSSDRQTLRIQDAGTYQRAKRWQLVSVVNEVNVYPTRKEMEPMEIGMERGAKHSSDSPDSLQDGWETI